MKKGRRSDLTNLVLFTQLGLSVISPIAVCVVIGLILRRYAGMPAWAMVFFILFGLISGMSSAWRLLKRMEKISAQTDLNAQTGQSAQTNGKEERQENGDGPGQDPHNGQA